jgi:hypothetical protein
MLAEHISEPTGNLTSRQDVASLSTEVVMNLDALSHFYFCFLLSLKMRERELPLADNLEKRRFMQKWLQTAKKKKHFCAQVFPEIQWLLEELNNRSNSILTIERNIELIYYRSQEMCRA